MSRPPIQHIELSPQLSLSECHPDFECRTNNWWLYDTRAGMNLGMREASREASLIKAIDYWAKRAEKYEHAFTALQGQVDAFVGQFATTDDDSE